MSKNALMHELDAANVWRPVRGTGGSVPTNSSAANIGIGGTFVGEGIDVSQYGTISVAIQASHSSATGGLVFQGSFDNSTWFTMEAYTYTASGLKIYSMAPAGKYFRVNYTNGGSATTAFNLLTTVTNAYTKPSSQRVGDTITAENDAELVKSVLAAQKPNGDFVDIDCTAGGNLKVSVEEYKEATARLTSTATITIGSSTTISSSVNLDGTAIVGFISPAAWTASTLKIQGSMDGTNFYDIYDSTSTAVSSWASINAATAYTVDVVNMLPFTYIRFVAGTAQAADRAFTVIRRPLA